MSTENRIFMVFSAFYLIMIRYRIGLRCIILLDCYIMNKESSLRAGQPAGTLIGERICEKNGSP